MTIVEARGPDGEGAEEHDLTNGSGDGTPHDGPWGDHSDERDTASPDTGRLEFGDEDVRLPWLETDGDDDADIQRYDTRQLLTLIVLGVIALAVIGGGIWWAVNHRKDEVLVADGSVVNAPAQPYKERPKDPGGKTFAGTGDTSFAVSEGQTRPARLGETDTPKPIADPSPKPSSTAAAAAPAPADVPGVGVQVAAYSNRAQAEAGWSRLSGQYEALAGLHHRVVEGQADIGTVYRLQVVTGDAGAARALCDKLKGLGLACQVKN